MTYSPVAERAFDALLQKLDECLERKAYALNHRDGSIDRYKLAWFHSFWAMELSALDEDAQLQIYNAISSRILIARKDLRSIEAESSAREVA